MASATSSSPPEGAPRAATSLRLRIAAVCALLVMLAILAQAFTIFLVFEEREDGLIDEIADQQLVYSIAEWRSAPERAAPNTPDMRLYRQPQAPGAAPSADEAAIAPPPPDTLRALAPGAHEALIDGRDFHVAVRDADGARWWLAYDAEEHDQRMQAIGSVILASALAIAAVVLGVVYLVAGRLTRELGDLARGVDLTADAGRDPSARRLRPGMASEVASLAAAFDRHEQRQRDAVVREREFTANVSHELRTPLAGIRSDAELMAEQLGDPAPDTHAGTLTDTDSATLRRRALRIVDAVDRLAELSSSLLTLARESRPQLEEALGLRDVLQQSWQALQRRHGSAATWRNDVPAAAVVTGDPALLRLVIDNLLDNAIKHGEGGPVEARLDGQALQVRDHGNGLPGADLARIFERGWQADAQGARSGHGLGLALVLHACKSSGWQAHAATAPDGGLVLSVAFGGALALEP